MPNAALEKIKKFVMNISILAFLWTVIITLYVYAMFIGPVWQNWELYSNDGFSPLWLKIQAIWHGWQGINVGILAFLSSSLIFLASKKHLDERHTDEQNRLKRQSDTQAKVARARLVNSLSAYCAYLAECGTFLITAWSRANAGDYKAILDPAPELSLDVSRDFAEYIPFIQQDYGNRLALILMKTQPLNSRLQTLSLNEHRNELGKLSLMSEIYNTAELQALINQLFGFAREEGGNQAPAPIKYDEIVSAYRSIGIRNIEGYSATSGESVTTLPVLTQQRIDRGAPEKL